MLVPASTSSGYSKLAGAWPVMPENKSPRGDENSRDDLGGDCGEDGILDVNVAALRFRAERMLFVLEVHGEKASTKTMLVLQMDIAARTFSSNPRAMYSDAIWSGVRAIVALGGFTGSISSEDDGAKEHELELLEDPTTYVVPRS